MAVTNTKRFGYARVSTRDKQETGLDTQVQILQANDCALEDIKQEKASGAGSWKDRPVLVELLGQLREGDVLVTYKLDRLSRSLKNLLEVVEIIEKKKAHLVVTSQDIDTTTTTGKILLYVMGLLSQIERDHIAERTRAGLAAARARGVKLGGRKPKLTPEQIETVIMLSEQSGAQKKSQRDIARILSRPGATISHSTIGRVIRAHRRLQLAEATGTATEETP